MSLSNTWKGKLEEASFFAVWKSAQAVCYNKKQKSEEISQCQRCHKNKEKKMEVEIEDNFVFLFIDRDLEQQDLRNGIFSLVFPLFLFFGLLSNFEFLWIFS